MGVYTWKHRQPSSVIGDPNRITRQARILPSIFKCYIGQVENFYLLICGVNTCSLEEEEKRRRKRGKVKIEESKREMRTEREREKNETPQHQKRNQRSWIVSIVAVPSRGKDVGNTRGWRGQGDTDGTQYATKYMRKTEQVHQKQIPKRFPSPTEPAKKRQV